MDIAKLFNAHVAARFMTFNTDVILLEILSSISSSEEKIGQYRYGKKSFFVDPSGSAEKEEINITQKKFEFLFRLESLEKDREEKTDREKADLHRKVLERLELKTTEYAARSCAVGVATGLAAIIAVVLSVFSLYISYKQVLTAEISNTIAAEQNEILKLELQSKTKEKHENSSRGLVDKR